MQVYLLLQAMDNNDVSRDDLAKELSIAYNTLNLKLNGKSMFTVPEVVKIKNFLNLTDDEFIKIFFNEKVA